MNTLRLRISAAKLGFVLIVLSLLVVNSTLVSSVSAQATSLISLESSLVTNGSFETPLAQSLVDTYTSGQSFGGWTVESIRGDESVDLVSGNYWQAADGLQSVDLNGYSNKAGAIYQDLITTPQQTYKLQFALSGNPEGQPNIKRSVH